MGYSPKEVLVLLIGIGVFLVIIISLEITQSQGHNSNKQSQRSAKTHQISCLADSVTFQPGAKGGLKQPSLRIWCANGDRYSFTPSSELPRHGDSTLELSAWKVTAFYRENGVNHYLDSLAIPDP
jgi:hypothetical protein